MQNVQSDWLIVHVTALIPSIPVRKYLNKSDISCLKNQPGTIQVKYLRLSSATGEAKLTAAAELE